MRAGIRTRPVFWLVWAQEARQPLSAAMGAFQVIRDSTDDERRQRACVVLERQFERLSRLLENLIEANRLGPAILRLERS
jgi:signal transduction histidine kinase